jgi:hypothetical protein
MSSCILVLPADGTNTLPHIEEQVPVDVHPPSPPLHPSHMSDIGIVLDAAKLIFPPISAAPALGGASPVARATTSSRWINRRSCGIDRL